MKILVLGHKGMLGRAVAKYFAESGHTVVTLAARYGESEFVDSIIKLNPDFIINGIGKIPQKKPLSDAEYVALNTDLPILLDTIGRPVVHPTTDCEFSGFIKPGTAYTKTAPRDATDVYGMSKAKSSQCLEESSKNTKIIRTSIIGHEESTTFSLLDWFLSQTGSVRGYTNHYWNGITTLEWAKQCQHLINRWQDAPTLTQLGTATHHSKYDILTIAKAVYEKDITITPFETPETMNKCLLSDYTIPDISAQLKELKDFFNK